MADATAFDTLETARNLEAAGVDQAQAQAHAREMAKAARAGRNEFVTNAELKAALRSLEIRMLKYLLAIAIAAVALTKYLPS